MIGEERADRASFVMQDALNVSDLKFAVGTTEAKMDMALGENPPLNHTAGDGIGISHTVH